MLQRLFKMQVLWRATIYCLRGCLFAICPQLVWKVKFQKKRSKRRSKVQSRGILDQGELQRGKKWSFSPPSMPCLSDFTSLQSSQQEMSECTVYVQVVYVNCVRKRAWKQEQAGSIVAGMITSLDLSYGKNKTSISHYLPFNQIPSFFASLPQNCHRLKISPFPYQRTKGSIDSQARRILFRTLMHTKRIEKTPASPIRQITSDF